MILVVVGVVVVVFSKLFRAVFVSIVIVVELVLGVSVIGGPIEVLVVMTETSVEFLWLEVAVVSVIVFVLSEVIGL